MGARRAGCTCAEGPVVAAGGQRFVSLPALRALPSGSILSDAEFCLDRDAGADARAGRPGSSTPTDEALTDVPNNHIVILR